MNDGMKFESKIGMNITRNRKIEESFKLKGTFLVKHYDKEGKLKGEYKINNGIVNEGKNKILDVMFNNSTPIANSSWFIGFINNAGFAGLAAADTMASHAGWTEYTAYSQTTRVPWGSGAASSQTTVNSTPLTFDINGGGGNLYGIFVTSNNAKGGTTGILWATGAFTTVPVPVSDGDQMKITYSVAC